MGMFDKDKSFGLDVTDAFPLNEAFALYGAECGPKDIETAVGLAAKTTMTVRRLDSSGQPEGDKFDVTTLASAIGDKAREAEPSDFPCKVELRKVASKTFGTDALVLQWVGDLDDDLDVLGPDDRAPVNRPKREGTSRAAATASSGD